MGSCSLVCMDFRGKLKLPARDPEGMHYSEFLKFYKCIHLPSFCKYACCILLNSCELHRCTPIHFFLVGPNAVAVSEVLKCLNTFLFLKTL